jgi:hypothetical protein
MSCFWFFVKLQVLPLKRHFEQFGRLEGAYIEDLQTNNCQVWQTTPVQIKPNYADLKSWARRKCCFSSKPTNQSNPLKKKIIH